MRCMILAPTLPWPLHGGRQINAHHLMTCMLQQGHEVLLVLRDDPNPAQMTTWPLIGRVGVTTVNGGVFRRVMQHGDDRFRISNFEFRNEKTDKPQTLTNTFIMNAEGRWNRFFGNDPAIAEKVARIADEYQPEYVEGCGLQTPLWMTRLPRHISKVWLAADEKLLFHGSMLKQPGSLKKRLQTIREAVQLALYERFCSRIIDAAVLVADDDAAMFRKVTGMKDVMVCPNGVDHVYFHPVDDTPEKQTAVFWGRLDFAPNVEAVQWFACDIWPKVFALYPQAKWRVIGRAPGSEIRSLLERTPGSQLIADAADIRPHVWSSSLVVLPVRSGSGIKNKLLEAAAMGMPIVASPNTVRGCVADDPQPWQLATTATQWVTAVHELWTSPDKASQLGQSARQWVLARDGWKAGVDVRMQWLWQSGRYTGSNSKQGVGSGKGLAA